MFKLYTILFRILRFISSLFTKVDKCFIWGMENITKRVEKIVDKRRKSWKQ